jgi:hypothetical protein
MHLEDGVQYVTYQVQAQTKSARIEDIFGMEGYMRCGDGWDLHDQIYLAHLYRMHVIQGCDP